MGERATTSPLEAAREAASRSDWRPAYELLMQADVGESLAPEDLALLADAAYAAGHPDVTVDALERSHAACLSAGDHLGAAGAAVRVALQLLMDGGLMAPVRGWATRTERLLEGSADTPVHAWLAVVRCYERLLSGDFPECLHWARQADELGTTLGVPGPSALGRVAEARGLVYSGEMERGLALLDEAAVATVSGELDPATVGMVFCELLCACQAAMQYDRAEEWIDAWERSRHLYGVGALGGRCRVHRAELLRLRGDCKGAEEEAMVACEELRPYLRREYGWPLTELGRIRLRSGNLHGAEEAFLGAHEAGWDPQPGLALLLLAQGDIPAAAASIRDALDHPLDVPSKELPPTTGLRLAPLLEAQAEIAFAAGDLDRARWAVGELDQVAGSFESKALRATALLSRGRLRLAEHEAASAAHEFDQALRLWNEVGAPYEAAVARMGVADAYAAQGKAERAGLERRAAQTVFTRLGTSRVPVSTTEPAVEVHLQGANVFVREGDYWSIAFGGRTSRLRDLRGLGYLARLLTDPGREFHVRDLAVSRGGQQPQPGDAGAMLDARAKNAYRRRLAEIEEDIAEAQALDDDERTARAAIEREFLIRELSRAVGFGGRDRRAGAASERARASVTQAIRHAIARISEHNPALGQHLDRTIRTGTYCVYLPDPRVPADWHLRTPIPKR
ncbi:MAG: hypothetical protein ACRDOW_02380 [Nocardioidaceae bacterium]